jgi:hypothetical protein
VTGELAQAWRRWRGTPTELAPGEPEHNAVRGLRRAYGSLRAPAARSASSRARAR